MTIYNVSTTSELNTALANANSGDTISLASGEYGALNCSNLNFGEGITIVSADVENPASFASVYCTNTTGITFDSVNFDYSYNSGDYLWEQPFLFRDSSNISVTNSAISGDIDPATGVGSGYGLSVTRVDGFTLNNTEVSDWYRGGYFSDSDNLTITNNDIHSIRSDGLDFVQVENVVIEGNYIHDFYAQVNTNDHRDMIQFWTNGTSEASVNITIRANIFDIGEGSWTQTIFMRNEEVDMGRAGASMFYQNILIEDNVIYNYHLHGITVGETNGLTVRNNSVIWEVGDPNAVGNPNISGAVTVPTINIASSSTNVTLAENIAANIVGYWGQSSWTMTGNVLISPSTYPQFFTAESLAAGSPHAFMLIPGAVEDGVGSFHLVEVTEGLDASGTNSADVITGLSFDDSLYGLGGNDILIGGDGDDLLNGGHGLDTMIGGLGADHMIGGSGHDTMFGEEGEDSLFGGVGEDILEGGADDDWLVGGNGDDLITAGSGQDFANGGNDNDEIYGGDGDDTLRGAFQDDQLFGGQGNDLIYGGSDQDALFGGLGNDTLNGGHGHDEIGGGDGNDRLIGNEGDDTIFAGDGADSLFGGNGNDSLDGGAGDDRIIGGGGNDYISDVSGTNLLYGRTGDDDIFGGSDTDYIYAGSQNDFVSGQDGNDVIYGASGDDFIFGGAGNDSAYGGTGNDYINAGAGDNDVSGNAGDDTFAFDGLLEITRIFDFEDGSDTIEIAAELLSGETSAFAIISNYGTFDDAGNACLTFGNGAQIVFEGVSNLSELTDGLFIV